MTRPAAIRALVKIGDDYAVVIDQQFLDALGITSGTPLHVSVEHGALVVTPLNTEDARRKRIDESLRWVNDRYGNAMRRLAQGPDDAAQSR